MRSRARSVATIVWISAALAGCASTKESVLPQDGPSMKAIYDAHFEAMGADDPRAVRRELGTRPLGDDEVDLAGYSRSAHTELDTLFPRLPNPTLVMYVFPHLAGAPVWTGWQPPAKAKRRRTSFWGSARRRSRRSRSSRRT